MHTRSFKHASSNWQELFDEEEVAKIVEYGNSLEFQDGLTGNNEDVDESYRRSKISWIDRNDDTQWIFNKLECAVFRLNSAYHGLDIDRIHTLQFTKYDEESPFYDWHWDMSEDDPDMSNLHVIEQRKLSAVVQLSDPEDYEGGELEMSICGRIFSVEKRKGTLNLFPSFVLHRVTPVTKGERYTLVAWYTGPDWK